MVSILSFDFVYHLVHEIVKVRQQIIQSIKKSFFDDVAHRLILLLFFAPKKTALPFTELAPNPARIVPRGSTELTIVVVPGRETVRPAGRSFERSK